jgi:hypothetical protein
VLIHGDLPATAGSINNLTRDSGLGPGAGKRAPNALRRRRLERRLDPVAEKCGYSSDGMLPEHTDVGSERTEDMLSGGLDRSTKYGSFPYCGSDRNVTRWRYEPGCSGSGRRS